MDLQIPHKIVIVNSDREHLSTWKLYDELEVSFVFSFIRQVPCDLCGRRICGGITRWVSKNYKVCLVCFNSFSLGILPHPSKKNLPPPIVGVRVLRNELNYLNTTLKNKNLSSNGNKTPSTSKIMLRSETRYILQRHRLENDFKAKTQSLFEQKEIENYIKKTIDLIRGIIRRIPIVLTVVKFGTNKIARVHFEKNGLYELTSMIRKTFGDGPCILLKDGQLLLDDDILLLEDDDTIEFSKISVM